MRTASIVSNRWPALAVWIGFWVFAFAATHVPVPKDAPRGPEGLDKLIHFGLYGLLTLLGARCVESYHETPNRDWVWPWALLYALYALFDEWSQAWVGRDTSLGDFIADLLGIAFASFILLRERVDETGR
jgi:VanZ family protein